MKFFMRSFAQHLSEKMIVIGKGSNYGQVVFLAGGAGSGKGFAKDNFLDSSKFKTRDVDEAKKAVLKLAKLMGKWREIQNLDLRKPTDVKTLHLWMEKKGFKDKTLKLLLSQIKAGRLPNLIFDVTLKNKNFLQDVVPLLVKSGYDPVNLHLVWVLTKYTVAVNQNRETARGRIVPEEILLQTHEGAANTMYSFIRSGTPSVINGSVHVILGGAENTVFWVHPKTGKKMDGQDGTSTLVKDFKYLTMKEPGKRMTSEKGLLNKVIEWIKGNVPRTNKTKDIFGSGQDKRE
jgi:dephospho-CoA kinase